MLDPDLSKRNDCQSGKLQGDGACACTGSGYQQVSRCLAQELDLSGRSRQLRTCLENTKILFGFCLENLASCSLPTWILLRAIPLVRNWDSQITLQFAIIQGIRGCIP